MVLQFPRLKTLLVIFLFVIGHGPPPVRMIDPEEIKAAALTAVTRGDSPTVDQMKKRILSDWSWVKVIVLVENWTRFPLLDNTLIYTTGSSLYEPSDIQPGTKEVFAARKRHETLTGIYGTVSWLVEGANRRFVLMWGLPYNFDLYSNWMGVGMTREGLTTTAEQYYYFKQMYYYYNTHDLKFVRKAFYYDENPQTYRDTDFEIEGWMTKIHNSTATVIFKPVNDTDLAPSVRKKLGLSD
uniref:Coluporin-24 n=1 Tax=Colubraria reticulata TaxID=604273 RepID=A0A499RN97_9CAEN|nr:coluporin-24 [Colubraria reticulata]